MRAYTPVFFGRFALHIPYDDISNVVVKRVRGGGKLRVQRTASHTGDVTIVTLGDHYLTIADLLRKKGVHVTQS